MTELTAESTMQDVLRTYPAAQRALMRRYHIGGCSSCGFSPEEQLGDVLRRHDVVDVAGVLDHLKASEEQEQRLQISPQELANLRRGDAPPPGGRLSRVGIPRPPRSYAAFPDRSTNNVGANPSNAATATDATARNANTGGPSSAPPRRGMPPGSRTEGRPGSTPP